MKRWIATALAIAVTFFGANYFIKTYQQGEANWKILVLTVGMAFLLYFSLIARFRRNR